MDIFEFHANLIDWLEGQQDDDVIRTLYESTTKMLGHETNELKLAHALVDTAYILLHSSKEVHGSKCFIELLESKKDIFQRAKTATAIQNRTAEINTKSES